MSDHAGDPKPAAAPVKGAVQAPPKSARPFRLAFVAFILIVVLAAVGFTVATHRGAFNGSTPLPSDRIANLETRVNQLAGAQSAGTGISTNDATSLKDRVDALEARLSALEMQAQSAPGSPDIASRLAALEAEVARAGDKETQGELLGRVTRLESQNSGESLRRAGSVLALATLARATRDASSFRVELDALAGTAPNDPVIAVLQPIADTGAPTTAILAGRFAQVARATLDAERKAGATDIFSRLWASVTGLVSIRPVGNAEGSTTADRLARAEAALGRDDLATAVRETEALTGAAASTMAPWLKDARARLTIERAVAQMDARIVQALVAAPAQSGAP